MKKLLHIHVSDVWMADYSRRIFCIGENRFIDTQMCEWPKEEGFVRFPGSPQTEEERDAEWEKERWEHIDTVNDGLKSFSSTEVIEEIDEIFGTFGFKNKAGDIIIEPQFASVGEFTHGLCPACLGRTWYITPEGQRYYETHWGYIDTRGKTVIPFMFREASSFNKYGLAVVSDDYLDGAYLIDTRGKMIENSLYPFLEDRFDYGNRFLVFSPNGSTFDDDVYDIGLYDTKERHIMYPPVAESFIEYDEDTILILDEGNHRRGDMRQRFINSKGESKYPWQVGKGFSMVERPNESGYSVVSVSVYKETEETKDNDSFCFYEGNKTVERRFLFGLLDGKGELALPTAYEKIVDLDFNIFACYNGDVCEVIELA